MEKIDARSISPSAQEHLRRMAVKAVIEGAKQKEVAKIFGVTRYTVCRWVKAYRLQGREALKARKKGRPSGGKLLPWQAAQIAKAVVDHHPEQLKLPFFLWTREAVALLIKRRFGVQFSVWTVGRYLKHWGFTPQKPARRAWQQNPEQVQHWLDQEYPGIRRQAQREKAQIYWGDEMGLRSDHAVGRSYGLKGQTPVILATGQRFGCNMVSAITNQGRLNFMVFHGRFTAPVFRNFSGACSVRVLDGSISLLTVTQCIAHAKCKTGFRTIRSRCGWSSSPVIVRSSTRMNCSIRMSKAMPSVVNVPATKRS